MYILYYMYVYIFPREDDDHYYWTVSPSHGQFIRCNPRLPVLNLFNYNINVLYICTYLRVYKYISNLFLALG